MNRLTVLYDSRCGFCVKCREWMAERPKFVELEFLASGGADAKRRFPELQAPGTVEELLVVSDEGGVYRGADAWLLCLWALQEYREWAERLASPLLRPLARGAFAMVSAGRKKVSSWLGLEAEDEELLQEFRRADPPKCGRESRTPAT